MHRIFIGLAVACLGWVFLETLGAQQQPVLVSPEQQERVLEVFGRNVEELEKNPDVLGLIPSPSTGEIWIITDRPDAVPSQVEGVPARIKPPPPHLPPPPGVIVLQPGGIIERRENLQSCPEGFKEVGKYRWRFCQPLNDVPQPIPDNLLNPPIAGISYEVAEKIFERNGSWLTKLSGVSSVGLEADGITVHTDQPGFVPTEVEGLPVKTAPREYIRRNSHTRTDETNPFHGGTAISGSPLFSLGTSTGIVLSQGKPWVALTAHTLDGCEHAPSCPPPQSTLNACPHYNGEPLFQSPNSNPKRISYASRWTQLTANGFADDVAAGFLDNDLIEGNGSLSVDRDLEEFQFPFHGTEAVGMMNDFIFIVTAISEPPFSTPHVNTGTIKATSVNVTSETPCIGSGVFVTSLNQLRYDTADRVLPGQSGSIILNAQGAAVGMHNAGFSDANGFPIGRGAGTKNAVVRSILGV